MLAARLRKWWAWLIAILVILMIGIPRIYLGVHFPQDVILGWLVGALLLWLVLRFWRPVTQWLKKMSFGQQVLMAFLASLVIILFSLIPYTWLKSTNWQAPQAWAEYAKDAIAMSGAFTTAGTFFGLLSGIVRFLLGAVGVLILYLGLKVVFRLIVPDSEALIPYIFRYVRYFLVRSWISAGAPWVFVRLNLAGKAY
jgi:hypothetical protein